MAGALHSVSSGKMGLDYSGIFNFRVLARPQSWEKLSGERSGGGVWGGAWPDGTIANQKLAGGGFDKVNVAPHFDCFVCGP